MKTAPAVLAASPGRIHRLLADKGYNANWLRAHLRTSGIVPVIPGTKTRKRPIRYDKRRYKDRWRAEAVFCRLKDFLRVATRYDKLARNYASAVPSQPLSHSGADRILILSVQNFTLNAIAYKLLSPPVCDRKIELVTREDRCPTICVPEPLVTFVIAQFEDAYTPVKGSLIAK